MIGSMADRIMEGLGGGVSIDDMYSEGMSFFTELIESEINLPIYFIEFEKIFFK